VTLSKQLNFKKHWTAEAQTSNKKKNENSTTSGMKSRLTTIKEKANQTSPSSEQRSSVVVYGNIPT
jgi:hypothetical protein